MESSVCPKCKARLDRVELYAESSDMCAVVRGDGSIVTIEPDYSEPYKYVLVCPECGEELLDAHSNYNSAVKQAEMILGVE